MQIVRDQGSFRDPSGYVAHDDGRIFRVLRRMPLRRKLKSSGLLTNCYPRSGCCGLNVRGYASLENAMKINKAAGVV
jgi:hypothetical protein